MALNTNKLTLENVEAMIKGLDDEAREKLYAQVKPLMDRVWLPQPGPQTEAFYSEADEMLYGGAAGGGKTDLLLGLALTAHENSVLFRRQSNDLDTLWDRLAEVGAPIVRKNDSQKKRIRTTDGRKIDGGHLEAPGSEKSHQGRARDFHGFDEGAQLDESKVIFVTQWQRSTTPGQRKRTVIATNPPIPEFDKNGVMVDSGSGDWLLRWFAPWLDARHPKPANEGELRWCFMQREGDRYITIWVDGPGYYDIETKTQRVFATEKDAEAAVLGGTIARARSRTFIRSLVSDNVFLRGTGYAERLSTTPEPLKSMLLKGDFTVRGEDHPMQVIPTNWVLQAEARWEARSPDEIKRLRQTVLSGDIAQGGADSTVLASLLETDYYEDLFVQPGSKTPTGKEVTAMILTSRRDKSLIVLDATGGWAGSTTAYLEQHNLDSDEIIQFLASEGSTEWTEDLVYKFANKRSEMWWTMRMNLDPKSGVDICLPPRPRLRAQLTTPHWRPKGKLLYIESKEEIAKRLQGASTDEADAVCQANLHRLLGLTRQQRLEGDTMDNIIHGSMSRRRRGKRDPVEKPDAYDPLKDW